LGRFEVESNSSKLYDYGGLVVRSIIFSEKDKGKGGGFEVIAMDNLTWYESAPSILGFTMCNKNLVIQVHRAMDSFRTF
jgi:hypothetical protein